MNDTVRQRGRTITHSTIVPSGVPSSSHFSRAKLFKVLNYGYGEKWPFWDAWFGVRTEMTVKTAAYKMWLQIFWLFEEIYYLYLMVKQSRGRALFYHEDGDWTSTRPQGVRLQDTIFSSQYSNYVRCWQDIKCTYEVTLRRVRVSTVAVEKQYYLLWVCFCSLRHPAWNAHAPYCHLWPVQLYYILPHYLTNGTILDRKLRNIKCVFWFSL